MGHIYCLMGKSSSGKDTVFRGIQEAVPELKIIVPYTTRPMREGEQQGVEYFFTDERKRQELQAEGRIIELRSYQTRHGVWEYFTVDDGQVDLKLYSYLVIGTLESFAQMCAFYKASGLDANNKEYQAVLPLYLEVDDGIRLKRALQREEIQKIPRYEELCRRFLADAEDFKEENLKKLGIIRKFNNLCMDSCLNEIILFIRQSL